MKQLIFDTLHDQIHGDCVHTFIETVEEAVKKGDVTICDIVNEFSKILHENITDPAKITCNTGCVMSDACFSCKVDLRKSDEKRI